MSPIRKRLSGILILFKAECLQKAKLPGVVGLILSLVFAGSLNAQEFVWSKTGDRFVYSNRSFEPPQIWICDLEANETGPAFDLDKLQSKLKQEFGVNSRKDLNQIRVVKFETNEDLIVTVGSAFYRVSPQGGVSLVENSEVDKLQRSRFFSQPVASSQGTPTANLTIKNDSNLEYQIYWIDFRGRPASYGQLKPKGEFTISTFEGHVWRLEPKDNSKESGCFRVTGASDVVSVDSEVFKDLPKSLGAGRAGPKFSRLKQPFETRNGSSGGNQVFVKGHNLFLKKKNSAESQLTKDANSKKSFQRYGAGTYWFNLSEKQANRGHLFWAPGSKHFVAFQTDQVPEPRVHYIESTPNSQLQPKLHSYQYPKPGDRLPINRPRLFDVQSGKEIPVSNKLFENPFRLNFLGWSPKGDRFWLKYNQRGHQVLRILEVNARTGRVKTLIEETSDTFIHYSDGGKSIFGRLGEDELLWASERSGWNHLFVYDSSNGDVKRQITTGNWNVKRLHSVDYDQKVIRFFAVGVLPNQDPYHEHFCRVNFDGTGFKVLTGGNGTQEVEFVSDKYLLATWSRVDQAPVREIRDAETGELMVELDRIDTKKRFGKRSLTTPFSAKGRDGKTDIWGVIHWPSDFDPEKKYPVVENIYAGPHDHHVPKKFRTRYFHQHRIADAGMIVVQIDGMGTAWRSKEFHDVCFQNLKDAGFPDRIAWMKAAANQFPQMDLSRVGIYGGSAGGQNAMAALLWHNDFYSVAVADCGCHDNRMDKIWWNEQWMGWPVGPEYVANSNMENANLLKGHLMLTLGEKDENVDPASTTQVVKRLIAANKQFEFVLIPGGGHGAGESPWAARKRLEFLKTHLQVE